LIREREVNEEKDATPLVICPHCDSEIKKEAKFCPQCGEKLAIVNYCPRCGTKVEKGEKYCSNCGRDLSMETPVTPTPTAVMHACIKAKGERPLGVTILAVLNMLRGGTCIFFSLISFPFGSIIFLPRGITPPLVLWIGIIALVAGRGFLRGIEWAWILGVIIETLGIALFITLFGSPFNPVSFVVIAVCAYNLYYLFTPNAKSWFGKHA